MLANETCAEASACCSARITCSARLLVEREPRLELLAQSPGLRAELAHAREQLRHERRRQLVRQRLELHVGRLGLERRHEGRGPPPRGARGHQLVREAAQVLDERGLQHARPGPDLAEAQRRSRLVRGQEALEPLGVEPAVAVAQQLDGQEVHARRGAQPGGGERRQLAVVGRRQVAADVHHLGLDQVEVVEQPLGRGRHGLAAVHVVAEQAVRLAQRAGVVGDAAVVGAAAGARSRGDLDLRGQVARVVLEPLDVQQLGAKRSWRDGVGPTPQLHPVPQEASCGAPAPLAPESTKHSR